MVLSLRFRWWRVVVGELGVNLLTQVVVTVALNVKFKGILPNRLIEMFIAFGKVFDRFLNFVVPLVVLKLIAPTVTSVNGRTKGVLIVAALMTCDTALFSNFLSCFAKIAFFPSVVAPKTPVRRVDRTRSVSPFFAMTVPPIVGIVASLVLTFALNLNVTRLSDATLGGMYGSFGRVVIGAVRAIVLPLLPVCVFNVFLGVARSKRMCGVLVMFVGVVKIVFLLRVFLLIFRCAVTTLFMRQGPFGLLKGVVPTCFATLNARSSTTAVPIALQRAIGGKIARSVTKFIVPLYTAVRLSKDALGVITYTLTLVVVRKVPFSFPVFTKFVFVLKVAVMTTPKMPKKTVVTTLKVLSSVLKFKRDRRTLVVTLCVTVSDFNATYGIANSKTVTLVVSGFFKGGGLQSVRWAKGVFPGRVGSKGSMARS